MPLMFCKKTSSIGASLGKSIIFYIVASASLVNAQPQSQLFQEWQADPATAILPDFSYSGFAHGEQSPPVITSAQLPEYHVRDFGAFPDDAIDDRVAIQRAIDTAGSNGGGIILFDAGRYILNSDGSAAPLWVRWSNIILRGAGSGEEGTLLYGAAKYDWYFAQWTQPSMVHVAAPILKGVGLSYGDWNGAPGQDWYTGDWRNNAFYPDVTQRLAYGLETIQRGSQRIKVDHPENFYPGQPILFGVREKMVVVDLLDPWKHNDFYYDAGTADDGWAEREFVIHQVVTVEAVEGQYIRIKERAEWTYKLEQSIELFPYHYIENVGTEEMRMEIVMTPREDRWDANGKGLQYAQVRNGWVNNIVFVNMQSGLNLSATMNVTVRNVRLEGEPFHDSFKFLAAKYSLMENAVIANSKILEDDSIKNTDHGFAAQHNAQLNVYLDPELPLNCSIDLHSGEPFSNLYDRVAGGRHGESGGAAMTLHALPYHTFWNWQIKSTDKVPYQFPVWTGNQTQPYSPWNIHMVKPIISGLHADPEYPNSVSVQFAAGHNFASGYFDDPRVVAERIGTRVSPDSLYLAQLSHRLSLERGRTEREGGVFIAIDSPDRVQAGVSVAFDLSQSISELPLTFFYSQDRKTFLPVTEQTFDITFNEVGIHEVTVRAVTQSGSTMTRHHRVEVYDDGIQVVPARSRYSAFPRSFHTIEAGPVWHTKLIYDAGLNMETSSMWISGNNFGIVNEMRDNSLDYGGIAYIELPAEGVNLNGTSYLIGISGAFANYPEAPRLVARDINGNWAILNQSLVSGMNTFDLAGKSWMDLPAVYSVNSSSSSFDTTKVTAVGLAHNRQKTTFSFRQMLLRIDEFEITRGVNTLPSVVLTSPSESSIEAGDSVTFSADASDAEGPVTRVEFRINGKAVASDASAPFVSTWKPYAPGSYQVLARAYDTTGNFSESAPVTITVTADTAPAVASLTGSSVATGTVGEPFNFTFGVVGKATSIFSTGLPAGLSLNAQTGTISGVPQRAGSYNLSAYASNAAGTSTVKVVTLTIGSPSDGALALEVSDGPHSVGDTVTLSATGYNIGSSVEFLVNGNVVATSSSVPHTSTWTPLAAGTYELQARSDGIVSSTLEIAILSPSADSVSIAITSPESGSSFPGGNPVISITGVLNDAGNDVAGISLYSNGTLLGEATVTGGTFSFDWTASIGYDQRIKAVARLHAGNGIQSEVVLVNVTSTERPTVEILSPSPTVPLDFREALRINGRTSDADGTIVRVEIWLGSNNRGNPTFDTFMGNAVVNVDGTWTYLASSNLPNGTLPVYAVAVDNTLDRTFSPVLRVFRAARFSDHPVYGDAGGYSMDLGPTSRWDLLQDGDNVVLLNRERSGYNYSWQNYLPKSRMTHFKLTGRFRLPEYPVPSGEEFLQEAIIGFGSKQTVTFSIVAGNSSGGTRLYQKVGQYNISILESSTPAVTSSDWVDFEITRVGNTATVKINGETIMSGSDNNLVGEGSIFIGNPRLNGSRVLWDDLDLIELDAAGQSFPQSTQTVTLSTPANQSLLPLGQAVNLSGSLTNIQGVQSIQLRSGSEIIGSAVQTGNEFSLQWTPTQPGNYALFAEVIDGDGTAIVSNVIRARTGTGLSGFNQPPSVDLLEPEENLTRVEYTPLSFTGTFQDNDGQVDSILMIVNGNITGAASRSGNSWSWTLPPLSAATYSITARATDDMGAVTESLPIVVTLTPNQLPDVAWNSPEEEAQIVANSQNEISVVASDPDSPLGNITSVTFYANGIQIGQGLKLSGEVWSINWSPRVLGSYQLQAKILDSNLGEVWSSVREITVVVDPDPELATVFYAGGSGSQELLDVVELSDGSILAVGSTSNLSWVPAGVTPVELSAPGLSDIGTEMVGFILHLSSDMQTVYGVYHLPLNYVRDLRWIRMTNKPGDPTGDLYVSGELSSNQYFIGRLDHNLLDGLPSGFDWTVSATTSGNSVGAQAWDVGGDGRVIYLDSVLNSSANMVQIIRIIDASGQPMVLPKLRGTHLSGTTDLTADEFDPLNTGDYGPRLGELFPAATASVISIPRDVRSQVVYERDTQNQIVFNDRYNPAVVWEEDTDNDGIGDWRQFIPDENGNIKRGLWPMDIFLAAINYQWKDGRWVTYGYTGYRQGSSIAIPAITIDKENNDFYFGASAQSVFYDKSVYGGPEGHQPDFEPFVIAYAADGEQKWWSRLYTEWMDSNDNGVIDYGPENENFWEYAEIRRSPPDQYVDGIAVDYSSTPKTVLVNGRAHGNAPSTLWSGNSIAANPGANGFQNNFTGAEGNIHVSWLGRMNADAGTLYNSTWVSGYLRDVAQTQTLYSEPIHDGWPSHNAGWPNLTSTWIEKASLRVGTDGRVYTVGVGPRMVTTFNAYQKMPRHTASVFEGNAPWSAYVRVLEPDLSRLAYSSSLTGIWTYDSEGKAVGADNTQLKGVYPTNNGVLVVGRTITDDGVARGNAIPVNNVPAWASSTPTGLTGVFGRLSFATNQNIGPAVYLTAPAGSVTVVPGGTLPVTAAASDFDGTIQRVEFYVDGALANTDFEAPYAFTWTAPMSQRNYTLVARAYDDEGASTNSSSRVVTVYTDNLPPAVAISSPADEAAYPRGTLLQIAINASDADGSIVKVEFFSDGELVSSKTSAPWTFLWNPPAGIHTLTARATDNSNAVSQSLPVEVTVGGPPVAKWIAVNFKDGGNADIDETATGGYYWNTVSTPTFSKSGLRTIDGSEITDLAISTGSNAFGFSNNARGTNMDVTYNGFTFPAAVAYSYIADNFDGDRNGHGTIRFFSESNYSYNFTILSAYGYNNPADNAFVSDFNVRGTYSTSTRTFAGGETVTLDSGFGQDNWSGGTLGTVDATAVEGGFEMILSVGTRIKGAYVNGVILEIVPSYQNEAPIVDAGDVQTVFDPDNDGFADVTLDGSGSVDPDEGDSIFSYQWLLEGEEITTGVSPTLTLPVGIHEITLVVRDEYFEESSGTVSITVLPSPGVAPTALASTDSPGQDYNNDGFGIVSLDGSNSYDSDAEDSIVSWKWMKGETLLAQGIQADINLAVGTHTLTLVVTDNWNKSGSVDFQVSVLASPGSPPVAVAPEDFSIENSEDKGTMPVPMDGSASYDPDEDALVQYQWKIGNSVIATGVSVAPILPVGTHTITLVVTDSWNMKGSQDFMVTVYRPSLVAPISVAGSNITVRDTNDSGFETVKLDGSGSYDPLGPIGIISYRWLLNGVEIATGVMPTVDLAVGVNVVTLIVKDDDQLEDSDTVTVTVQPAYDGPRSVIAVTFNSGLNDDQASPNGIYWNGMGTSTTNAVTLRDSTGNLTDVTLELTNPFDFAGFGRGINQRVEVNGFSVPASVMSNYVATNYDNSRDGLAIARIKSNRNYRIKVTVLSSVNNNNPADNVFLGMINFGGVWGGAFNRSFVGGESITVDGGKGIENWDFARSNAWFPAAGESFYQLDLGFGASGSNNSGGVVLNALILELTDLTDWIPDEPESGFAGWIADAAYDLHGADQDLLADPDGDTITNMMEYALRLNPSVYGRLNDIIYLHQVGNEHRFRFRFNNDATDTTYQVEYSETLTEGSWNTVPQENIVPIATENGSTVLEATLPTVLTKPVFVRLRASIAN